VARRQSEFLTQRESQVMEVLWTEGDCTAESVRQSLADDLHDSTVRTILRVLESKGQVVHSSEGKSYVYRAKVPRQRAQKAAVRTLINQFFRGSAEQLVLRLIEDEAVTPEQIQALRKTLDRRPEIQVKKARKA
jgi:BlaI family transcriptional regulator, penicillinase repressor